VDVYQTLVDNPYLWVFGASLAAGGALAQLAVFPSRRRNPTRARTVKWVLFCVNLSVAVSAVVAGIFLTDLVHRLDRALVYFALIVVGLAFLGLRFKKAVGIPMFVLVTAVVVLSISFLQAWGAFTGETEIAEVTVLAATGGSLYLELELPDDVPPTILAIEGEYFAPVVEMVIFEDWCVFLGRRSLYRFIGLSGFVRERDETGYRFRQTPGDYYFPEPSGITGSLYQWFEANEQRIPGVKSVQVEVDLKRARTLHQYSIRVQSDGGVQIIDVSMNVDSSGVTRREGRPVEDHAKGTLEPWLVSHDTVTVMMITFYKAGSRGTYYYSVHDRQGNLFTPYSFTVVWGRGSSSGKEKVHSFASQEAMDKRLQSLVRRKIDQGYTLLYSYIREDNHRDLARTLRRMKAS
jgi:predicted DNA-binding WGR domain protein